MRTERKKRGLPSVRGGQSRGWLLIASLMVNAALGAWLLRLRQRRAILSPQTDTEGGGAGAASSHDGTNSLSRSSPPAAPAFHWSDIESADYREYVANLRGVGCPEQVIRDIIVADLNQLYTARRSAIWSPPESAYWQKSKNDRPEPDHLNRLMALDREKAEIVKELVGFSPSMQGLLDTVFLQLHGSEHQLLFLPKDKMAAALQALSDADFEEKELKVRAQSPNQDVEGELFEEKLKVLAKVLSPAELQEFKLRNSPGAQSLRNELRFFECTPEEFKALLDLRDQKAGGKSASADLLNRAAATEEVRQLFGEQRAKEFERVTDLYYVNARLALEREGLSVELADQAWQICQDAATTAEKVGKDSSLLAEERKRQIQALESRAEAQLTQVLGEKAARPVRRDLRTVLHVASQRVRG